MHLPFSRAQIHSTISLSRRAKINRTPYSRVIIAVLTVLFCGDCSFRSNRNVLAAGINIQPDPPTSPFRPQLSMSTENIEIHTRSSVYHIPRNYIAYPDPAYPVLRVTYPGLKPLTDETQQCLEGHKLGCIPIELRLHGGDGPAPGGKAFTNRQMLESDLKYGHFEQRRGPSGYLIYSQGPKSSEIKIYVKKSFGDIIMFNCYPATNKNNSEGVCDDQMILDDGNAIKMFFSENKIRDIPDLELHVRQLFNKFSTSGAN